MMTSRGHQTRPFGSPTQAWIAALGYGDDPIDLPALTGAAGVAERLLLLVHYGVDWDGWPGTHRKTYWEKALADRVVAATYRSDTLRRWWREVTSELSSAPRNEAERIEVAQLLGYPDPGEVLEILREEAEPLILRVRIIADAVRRSRTTSHNEETP